MSIKRKNALLRFYFKIDGEKLNDEDWCKYVSELNYALDFDSKLKSTHGELIF